MGLKHTHIAHHTLPVGKANRYITKAWQCDMNLSPLALPCSRMLWVHGGFYDLPCSGRALGCLPTELVFFSSRWVERRFHSRIRPTNHFIRNWAPSTITRSLRSSHTASHRTKNTWSSVTNDFAKPNRAHTQSFPPKSYHNSHEPIIFIVKQKFPLLIDRSYKYFQSRWLLNLE